MTHLQEISSLLLGDVKIQHNSTLVLAPLNFWMLSACARFVVPGLVFTQTGNAQWPLGSLDLMCSVKNNFGVSGPVELLNHQRKIWTATLIPSLKLIANASKHQPLEDEVLLGFGTLCPFA